MSSSLKKKGYRKSKGVPVYWDEVKKHTALMLTPTAIAGLDTLARSYELSRSEFVEKVGRGIIPVPPPPPPDDAPLPPDST